MPADPHRVKELFMAVSGLPAAERAAALDRECAGDADLRQRVAALLDVHEEPGSFLNRPASNGTAAYRLAHGLEPGQIFAGRFKLREELGEGGMGVVFVADQIEPVQRRVALKVIKTGADSARVLARFEQERQALALMDHPNIAKVLDAGMSRPAAPGAPALPYFVMELIKGVPLTRYCDDAKLTPRQRLELFIPVCQAVQHAHQKGIIHRDLKPSNILVGLYDGKPIPKVIDFGVAKATGPRLSEHSVYTEVGSVIGTLEYMSPEQAELNNLDIDTRSDIYALGVILYELLTGTVPFTRKELQSFGFAEMLRVIKEREPPKPSTRLSASRELPTVAAVRQTEPAKLSKLVRGDLDWITMKALEKNRSRRYETANGLALDIQQYLSDEPVLAGPPSAGYRLRKFARRNKGPVLAAAAVAIALLGGAAITTWQAVRAKRAEVDARREEANAVAERARADEEAATATALYEFAREKIIGEFRASADELGRILDEMVDGPTAKSRRAQFVASFRRFKRANDALRSLAEKASKLPPRTRGQDNALESAAGTAAADLTQKMLNMITVAQRFPIEMTGVLQEALGVPAPPNDDSSILARAVLAAIAAERQSPGSRLAKEASDKAMASLRKYFATVNRDVPDLLHDPDLAVLRNRHDWADLLWDLADAPTSGKQ
jgi:serine/threonine protein kinase